MVCFQSILWGEEFTRRLPGIIPAGYDSHTGYQYDSISRVAGHRELAPPSKFSKLGGFNKIVFITSGILDPQFLASLFLVFARRRVRPVQPPRNPSTLLFYPTCLPRPTTKKLLCFPILIDAPTLQTDAFCCLSKRHCIAHNLATGADTIGFVPLDSRDY